MKRITDEQKATALTEFAKCGSLEKAAKAAGVSYKTLWLEQKRNAKFKQEVDEARAQYADALELILDQRIREGVLGKDKASAILLMFRLKGLLPEVYRERMEHKVEGSIKIISGVPRPPTNPQSTSKELT